MRGSSMAFFMPASRTSRDGQATHENTTVSLGSSFTACGNDVVLPVGTSSPQASTVRDAPYSLKTLAYVAACWRYLSRLAVGTATTNPSMYSIGHSPCAAVELKTAETRCALRVTGGTPRPGSRFPAKRN